MLFQLAFSPYSQPTTRVSWMEYLSLLLLMTMTSCWTKTKWLMEVKVFLCLWCSKYFKFGFWRFFHRCKKRVSLENVTARKKKHNTQASTHSFISKSNLLVLYMSIGQLPQEFGLILWTSPVVTFTWSNMSSAILGFNIEWFDPVSKLVQNMYLKFFVDDNTVEIMTDKSCFLKRIHYPEVSVADLFLGNTITM